MTRERFVLPDGCDFDSLYNQRRTNNIGKLINIALDTIENANREKLEGVFRNIDFNSEGNLGRTKESNTRLQSLLEDFANPKLDLRPTISPSTARVSSATFSGNGLLTGCRRKARSKKFFSWQDGSILLLATGKQRVFLQAGEGEQR